MATTWSTPARSGCSRAVGVAGAPQFVLAGGHQHVVTVVGYDPAGQVRLTAGDPTNYTGTRPTVEIFKDLNAAEPLHPTLAQQADNQATAPHLGVGSPLVWTYRVITNSTDALTIVSVVDDNGTATTSDDWAPRPVLVTFRGAAYNAGDTNFDHLLETNETWLFTSAGVAGAPTLAAPGWQQNIGTVTATDFGGAVSVSTNPAWYFGDSGLALVKAVNALDPQHPTAAEDANTTGPRVPVGSTVVFSYLVTNTSGGPMTITGLVDDNGTATVADDIQLAAMTALLGTDRLHNIGDVNRDGVFDRGETWVFQWSTVAALGGPFTNTATVSATTAAGQTATASDIAQYTGLGAHVALHTAVNAADPLHPTAAEDANNPTGPYLPAGSTVTFTYLVTNDGALALTDVVVTDDHGTATTVDDFTATPVLNGNGAIIGDANGNGVLDIGETWLFTSVGTVSPDLTAIVGQYRDGSAVSAAPAFGPAVTSADPTYYTGIPAGGILIRKAVDAADPAHPTTAEDANDPAHPYYVAVGGPAVFTYLVSSPNGLSLAGAGIAITDDNGTADLGDDFHPVAVTVLYHKVSYNVGDTNHNGEPRRHRGVAVHLGRCDLRNGGRGTPRQHRHRAHRARRCHLRLQRSGLVPRSGTGGRDREGHQRRGPVPPHGARGRQRHRARTQPRHRNSGHVDLLGHQPRPGRRSRRLHHR